MGDNQGWANTDGNDWEEMAKVYNQLTKSVGNRPITAMLDGLNERQSFSSATGILDNGCGPGPIMSAILREYGSQIPKDAILRCSDFSPPMIEQVKKTKQEQISADPTSPWARIETTVLDAQNLEGIPDASISHLTAGWVYFFTQAPQKCLSESKRVLVKDGHLACSSWKGSDWMDIMGVVGQIRAGTKMPEIPAQWRSAEGVKEELEKAGFQNVEAREVGVEMTLDAYEPFIDMVTTKMPHVVALTKDFSDEERQRLRENMLAKTKEYAPTVPTQLKGTAVICFGKK